MIKDKLFTRSPLVDCVVLGHVASKKTNPGLCDTDRQPNAGPHLASLPMRDHKNILDLIFLLDRISWEMWQRCPASQKAFKGSNGANKFQPNGLSRAVTKVTWLPRFEFANPHRHCLCVQSRRDRQIRTPRSPVYQGTGKISGLASRRRSCRS